MAVLAGLDAMPIDGQHGQHMGMLTPGGLAIAIVAVIRTTPGGLVFLAPKCCNWVWINQEVMKRPTHDINGDTSVGPVKEGYELSRCVALI